MSDPMSKDEQQPRWRGTRLSLPVAEPSVKAVSLTRRWQLRLASRRWVGVQPPPDRPECPTRGCPPSQGSRSPERMAGPRRSEPRHGHHRPPRPADGDGVRRPALQPGDGASGRRRRVLYAARSRAAFGRTGPRPDVRRAILRPTGVAQAQSHGPCVRQRHASGCLDRNRKGPHPVRRWRRTAVRHVAQEGGRTAHHGARPLPGRARCHTNS